MTASESQDKLRTLPREELEERLIYSAIVAGKSAKFTDAVMGRLKEYRIWKESPFETLRRLIKEGTLASVLRTIRSGNYTKLEKFFREIVKVKKLNLETVTPEQLEVFHGIGPKTSRFFIIWTRPQETYAALDVHVLRWMRAQGYDAPKSTPTGAKYRELEEAFILEAEKRGMSARDLDFHIWSNGSGYTGTVQTPPPKP